MNFTEVKRSEDFELLDVYSHVLVREGGCGGGDLTKRKKSRVELLRELLISRAGDGVARAAKQGSALDRLVRFGVISGEKDTHHRTLRVTVLLHV